MSPSRSPSDAERRLWRRAMQADRTYGAETARESMAALLSPSDAAAKPTATAPADSGQAGGQAQRPAAAPRQRAGDGETDRRSLQRLARGQFPIDAKLDLHGMNRIAAHAALVRFIEAQTRGGARCVLVITGKGSLQRDPMTGLAQGVLRGLLPLWLAEPPLNSVVLAHRPARAQHGGAGAWYLLLRRPRGAS